MPVWASKYESAFVFGGGTPGNVRTAEGERYAEAGVIIGLNSLRLISSAIAVSGVVGRAFSLRRGSQGGRLSRRRDSAACHKSSPFLEKIPLNLRLYATLILRFFPSHKGEGEDGVTSDLTFPIGFIFSRFY